MDLRTSSLMVFETRLMRSDLAASAVRASQTGSAPVTTSCSGRCSNTETSGMVPTSGNPVNIRCMTSMSPYRMSFSSSEVRSICLELLTRRTDLLISSLIRFSCSARALARRWTRWSFSRCIFAQDAVLWVRISNIAFLVLSGRMGSAPRG